MRLSRRAWVSLPLWPVAAGVLAGCSLLGGPCRLGFIGPLSQRRADLGLAGRNGAILAVDACNATGGLQGQPVELWAEDDASDDATAVAALQRLLAARVEAVIGPFTTLTAQALLPQARQHGLLLLSPTLTVQSLAGQNDLLFRLNRSTRQNAAAYAWLMQHQGWQRVTLVCDDSNGPYAAAWAQDFRQAFEAQGGTLNPTLGYQASRHADLDALCRRILHRPCDALMLVASSLEVARLCQRLHRLAPDLPRAASDGAATQALLELGGHGADGLVVLQPFNPHDTSPSYQQFAQRYRQRFDEHPGYAAVAGHDAAQVLLQALARRAPGQTLKQALLSQGPFSGLQQPLAFDASGDAARQAWFVQVRQGEFVPLTPVPPHG